MYDTLYELFTSAEKFPSAIKEVYRDEFNKAKKDYIYLTDLVIVLNHKIREHYEKGNEKLSHIYNDLWGEADMYACDNLKGEQASYFFRETD